MATKLKHLKIKKVDFVDDGANPEAFIRLYKSKDGAAPTPEENIVENPKFWNRFMAAVAKAFKLENEQAEDGPETEDVAKGGAESFGDKFSEVKNRKICDEVWDICYALQSSICSILNDEELDSTQAGDAMRESLNEFTEVVSAAIGQWSGGKAASIAKKETEVTASELELMKSNRDRLEDIIAKATVVTNKGPEQTTITEPKGETEMSNIDKSKLTEAERAFYESIEKRYGTPEAPAQVQTPAAAPETGVTPTPEAPVAKSTTQPETAPAAPEADDIYKGLSPAVKAELEALRKFRSDAEDNAIREVAKRYAVIGKTEEELFPVLKSMKEAGGTAYADTIAMLDKAVDTIEKSAAFTEIGKSGSHGATTEGAAWAKAETQAAEIMKSKNVTKAQALDEVFQNDPALAAECEKED